MHKKLITTAVAAVCAGGMSLNAMAAESLHVGHIADFSGPTSGVGKSYGQGVADAMAYVNANGGINGKQIDFETFDYSYKAPVAVAHYKKLMSKKKLVALQGWGTADTEALVRFVANDKVHTMSASFSAHLTDPMGKSPRTKSPAPYNFFYGPSYSDGCRGVVQWAANDWKKKGGSGKPKFVHMGMNHPYPNAPKESCGAYAKDLGFEVLNEIQYSLKPGDFKAQCLSLKNADADYAYLANTAGSNISLIKSCDTVGVKTQYLSNVWGWDMNSFKTAGKAGDGVVWVMSTASWTDKVPGSATLRAVSKMSDPSGNEYRPVHYIRGVCAALNMRDAMLQADAKGKITGTSIKEAMETFTNHVPKGMEGVCMPSTFAADDHRGMLDVLVYQTRWNNGNPSMSKVYTAELPRRDDWLGW